LTHHLFAYGTLLPGREPEGIAPLVGRLAPIGLATVPGRLYDLGAFPGAVPDETCRDAIRGRVLAVADAGVLPALDAYEGDGPAGPGARGFVRERVVARLEDGRALACWIYAYRGDLTGARLVPGGDYWRYRDARE
jgi:gamma-glutamylcyclotransferase (GGCT)/AIG2-like uncharacterized protein YtfP